MKVQKILILVIFFITLFGCNDSFISIEEVCKKYDVNVPTASEYPDEDAVIILHNTDWNMKFNENFNLMTSKKVHVIKKLFKNLNNHSIIKIPVFQGDEILEISARTIKPDSTIIAVGEDEIYTIEGIEGETEFYSDVKFKKFTFPGLEDGCLIEYSYEKRVMIPFLRDIWVMQRDIPIIHSEYSLTVLELLMTRGQWTWNYKVYNDNNLNDVKREEVFQNTNTMLDKQVKFYWEKKDIQAVEIETLMPKGLAKIPHIRFRSGFWKAWNDISKWYYTMLFKPKVIITEEIENKAKALIVDTDSRRDKIKACYDFVKDIRYISINMNNNGISPNKPAEVLENKYGDCKDKSILLISLLNSLDIEAEPVLLLTNNEGSFDKNFPAWNFNHMIVAVKDKDDKYIWMDPTARFTEFGDLPAPDMDIDVLVLHDDGTSSIERTLISDCKKNKKSINVNIEISENLESNIEFDLKYFGEDRSRMKSLTENSSEKEIKKFCKSMITDDFLNSTIDSVKYSDSLSEGFFNLGFLVKNINIVQQQGNLFFVSHNFLPFVTETEWLISEERKYPLAFPYPRTINKNIVIIYPKKLFKLKATPKKYTESEKGLISHSRKVSTNSNIINISKDLVIKKKLIKVYEYKNFRSIFESLQQRNKEQLIFERM
jgi:hypothetical protein